ncbi:competence/damage-inducible protein A [Candidatus Endomicrobiellum devescovinae]|uniref:competence/damage-inducible protein A n=1 Tax=Candidatus Endomicrobiellum devescovinae TaxID=3242322 RepID=UPI002833E511|nr:competence/damage-inducible protein A [Endomicrobium sp.]
MKIELICTGSELLAGKLNTNAAYIGSRLFNIGLELSCITDIGDKKQDLAKHFNIAFSRSNIIVVTGGLGPTFDDITVETAAECLRLPIYSDEKVLKSIQEYFAKKSISKIPKINERQANILSGAKVLENRLGTAPGQMLHFEFKSDGKKCRKTLFLLPGPPREMKPMFEENVEPFLKSYSSGIRKNVSLRVFGLSESAIAEAIKPVIEEAKFGDSQTVEFGILASDSIVDIKFAVSGSDEFVVDSSIKNLNLRFGEVLKDNIFGYNDDSLASVVGKLLIQKRKTISFAESCTGGKIASAITDIAGSSLYFKSSVVTYSNESKLKILGVKEETLKKFGAVSEETAKEMARGILNLSGSDYAFSVTGIAGPGGGSKDKPVGLVYVGFANNKKAESFKFNFVGTRKDIRDKTVNTVLDCLRKKLIEKQPKK